MKTASRICGLLLIGAFAESAHGDFVTGTLEINATVFTNCSATTPAIVSIPLYDQDLGNVQAFTFALSCVNPVASAEVEVNSLATVDANTWYMSGPGAALNYQIENTDTSTLFENDIPQAMDLTNPLAPTMNAAIIVPANQGVPSGNYVDFQTVTYTFN
jgi:hypothetical protein